MYHINMGALKVKDAKRRAEYLGPKLLCVQDTEPIRAVPACRLSTATRDSSSGYGRSSPPLKWFPFYSVLL